MQKFMWIVLIIAVVALALSVFSLYRTIRLAGDKSALPDPSNLIPRVNSLIKNRDDAMVSQYEVVMSEELWEKRGELSGKAIEVTTELDTDTMTLQPTPFPNPITLKKPDFVDTNKDTWIRNQGKQTVVIQGVFHLHLAIGEDGTKVESYSLIVDQMFQKVDAKQFYIWPDKKTPTEEMNARILDTFDTETLKELNGKPVTYVGMYTIESGVSMLDGKLVVNQEKVADISLLKTPSQGNTRVRVKGIFRLKQDLHGLVFSIEAGEVELLADAEQE